MILVRYITSIDQNHMWEYRNATDVFDTDTLNIMEDMLFPIQHQLNMKILKFATNSHQINTEHIFWEDSKFKVSAFSMSKTPIFYVNWPYVVSIAAMSIRSKEIGW